MTFAFCGKAGGVASFTFPIFLMLVGCTKPDANTASLAGSATTTGLDTAAQAGLTIPTACHLDGTAPRCLGLLDPSVAANPTWEILSKIVKDNTKGGGDAYRKVFEKCPQPDPCHHADTEVNTDMQKFDFRNLPQDRAIVIGAMRWRPKNPYSDTTYRVGLDVEDTQQGRRTIFVVYPRIPNSVIIDPKYGVVRARWKLFGMQRPNRQIVLLDTGYVVDCLPPHKDTKLNSGFRGCPGLDTAHQVALSTGLDLEDVLSVNTCEAGRSISSAEAAKAYCDNQRKSKVAALEKLLQLRGKSADLLKPLGDTGDSSDETYWFSCANGCCTADMPSRIGLH
jgi:hypothetical protein